MPRLRDIPDFPEKPQHDAYTSLEMKDMGVVTAVIVGGQVVPNGPIKEGSTVVIISKVGSCTTMSWQRLIRIRRCRRRSSRGMVISSPSDVLVRDRCVRL